MFNLQGSEIIFILLIALVVLGPEKLPSAIKRAMSLYNELRKLSTGFQDEFKSVLDEPLREMKSTADLIKKSTDPKRMAEEAERESEMTAAAAKKERQARETTEAMETAGAAHLAESAEESTAEIEPAGDAFDDPVDDEQNLADEAAEKTVEIIEVPRLASVDLDAGSEDERGVDAGDEPDDESEEKSA